MPVSAEASWRLLRDIEAVAGCMPGAKITGRTDETHYQGAVTARVGPATLSFEGTIEVLELDSASRTLRMIGKGSDRSGASAASMDLTARIESAPDGNSVLEGRSEVSLTGKAATFGGRMIGPVSDQILKQFAANFAKRLQEAQSGEAGEAASLAHEAGDAQAQPSLNALALLWGVVKDALRRLFGRRGGGSG